MYLSSGGEKILQAPPLILKKILKNGRVKNNTANIRILCKKKMKII